MLRNKRSLCAATQGWSWTYPGCDVRTGKGRGRRTWARREHLFVVAVAPDEPGQAVPEGEAGAESGRVARLPTGRSTRSFGRRSQFAATYARAALAIPAWLIRFHPRCARRPARHRAADAGTHGGG